MNEIKDSQDASIAVDTGVLFEFLDDSDLGKTFYQEILKDPQFHRFYISPLTDTELKYLMCRQSGYKDAKEIISDFLKDFIIYPESELRDEAFLLKCNYPISIADCYSLAVGKLLKIPVYMKKEKEITQVLDALEKLVEIRFIDDMLSK